MGAFGAARFAVAGEPDPGPSPRLLLSGASDRLLVFDLDPAEPAQSLLDVG
jgi:hypothetical protein